MRTFLIGLAALILFGASGAAAQDHERQDRGRHDGYGRPGYSHEGFERGGDYRGGETYGPRFGREGYAPPAYPGPRGPYGPGPGGGYRGFTRGQFLPPAYLGGAAVDPGRYHLRRPPNGYGWVTVGPNAYLTQRSTGLILDTAPLY